MSVRVLKSYTDPIKLAQDLTSLPDELFIQDLYKDNYKDLIQWTNLFLTVEENESYFFIKNTVESYMSTNYIRLNVLGELNTDIKDLSVIEYNTRITQCMSQEEKDSYIDRKIQSLLSTEAEYIPDIIFNKDNGYTVIHEPNGKNECPDLCIIKDNKKHYVEIKSVLCSFYDDNTFKGNVNNAMKGIDQILSDMQQKQIKENKCHTNLYNTTIIFFLYFINPRTYEAIFFRTYVIPAPLAVSCEFNKDGTFKKLSQKSNNNFNATLSLKVPVPYNKYNSLADRASIIATGKTLSGNNHMISNMEGDYLKDKEQFNNIYYKIKTLFENNNDNIDIEYIKKLSLNLISSKYNKTKYKHYITQLDKDNIKFCIQSIKSKLKEYKIKL